jgi:DNA helicase HerA-like ATPase
MPTTEDKGPTHREALRAFEQIAKEGRKYGVGLMIVSQRPADVSRTVLAQCNNFVVLRLTNDQDQDVIAQLVPQTLARLTDVLPLLDVGEALLLGDALLLPTRVKLDPPSIAPASATRAFWNDWADQPSSAAAIVDGVEALRRQVRPSGWRDAVEPLTR